VPLANDFITLAHHAGRSAHFLPCRAITAIMVLLLSVAGAAAQPLHDPDNGPYTGLFGWPGSTEGGVTTPAGKNAWGLSLAISSHSVEETRANESILLDGETRRLGLSFRRGLSRRLELGIEMPWVWHESGNLDSLIREWHEFFGLPQGNRAGAPEDRLLFEFVTVGLQPVELSRNANGMGDLRIHAGWQLRQSPTSSTALRASIKLPTGDSAKLSGSGGTDLALGLAGDVTALWNVEALEGFYRFHAIRLGQPDLLASSTHRLVGQLTGGVAYRLSEKADLTVQSTLRSAAYDVNVEALGGWSMSMTFGATLALADRWRLAIAVSEDIRVETAPDVTFLLNITRHGL
jgi:hypothetical protein